MFFENWEALTKPIIMNNTLACAFACTKINNTFV